MYTLFRALLAAIHILYALFSALHNFYHLIYQMGFELWHGDNPRIEMEILARGASRIQKIPRHLVIVFGPKEDTIFECVKIIGWCVTLGIPYISFFDSTGFILRNERSLKIAMAKNRPDLIGDIAWGKPSMSGKNGLTDSKCKTRVWLLSDADGKGEIVSLTQELASAIMTGSIKPEEINDNLLNEKLSLRGIPNPDLALVYGQFCSTYGLLPWHTRTTEFMLFSSAVSLSVRDFTHLLDRYSNCEQRYGK